MYNIHVHTNYGVWAMRQLTIILVSLDDEDIARFEAKVMCYTCRSRDHNAISQGFPHSRFGFQARQREPCYQ